MRKAEVQHGPAPVVRLNKCPRWLPRRIRQAIREGRLPKVAQYASAGQMVCSTFSHSILFDHWGKCGDLFVMEPYRDADCPEVQAEANRIARLLGVKYRVTAESNWNPPGTIRIEFYEGGEV